jgi:hypothetical protein
MFWDSRYAAFVSYSHNDDAVIKPLVELLQINDQRVFWDQKDIVPGDRWEEVINSSLRRSNVLVLFWCCDAHTSTYVGHEVQLARKFKKKVIPVKLCHAAMPEAIAAWQWIDLQHFDHKCLNIDHQALPCFSTSIEPNFGGLMSKRVRHGFNVFLLSLLLLLPVSISQLQDLPIETGIVWDGASKYATAFPVWESLYMPPENNWLFAGTGSVLFNGIGALSLPPQIDIANDFDLRAPFQFSESESGVLLDLTLSKITAGSIGFDLLPPEMAVLSNAYGVAPDLSEGTGSNPEQSGVEWGFQNQRVIFITLLMVVLLATLSSRLLGQRRTARRTIEIAIEYFADLSPA